MKKTIRYRMLSSFLVCVFLCGICILGVISKNMMVLIPFVYALINYSSYVFWLKTGMAFPFYFHIGMTYLIISHTESISILQWFILWCGVTVLVMLVFTLVGIRKHEEFGKESAWGMIIEKYRSTFYYNPVRIKRAAVHSLILFVISWSEFLVYDYKGFWIMISAGAVMIGEDFGKIGTRGIRRISGAFLGFAIGGILLMLGAGKAALIICYAVALVVSSLVMPDKYILGSACIGLQAVSGNAIADGSLSFMLIMERLVWTIVGAVLTISLCSICGKIFNGLYEDKQIDKLIVKKSDIRSEVCGESANGA